MADEMVVEGEQIVLAQLTARMLAATEQTMAAINAVASAIETEAKKRCPVATGKLQASITTTPATNLLAIEATVGTKDVEYSGFVELGTVKMHAQPFLEPAFMQETAHLDERIAAAITLALRA